MKLKIGTYVRIQDKVYRVHTTFDWECYPTSWLEHYEYVVDLSKEERFNEWIKYLVSNNYLCPLDIVDLNNG